MLELAILGLLKEQPLHGYELKKRVGETLGTLWGISYGSLYPALRRLERDGAIEGVDPETTAFPAPIPATGSLAGDLAAARARRGAKPSRRTRKVYRLTPTGEARLQQLLLDGTSGTADDERTFAMKLAFCGHLDPAARVELLERRRSALADRLARAQRLGTGRGDRYARSLFEHRTQATQRDLEWVEALIEAETDPKFSNRRSHRIMSGRIRVAIAGVGNCASSLVQGVEYYRNADPADDVPGLMHVVLGGYHVGDVDFVAAFDVDAAKVGLDLGKAISAGANNTIKFANVGALGVQVLRAPTFDGLGKYYRETIEESPAEPVDVVQVLRNTGADVLVSYLPVGSEEAQRFYAAACLEAGVGFVNAIPVFIASDPVWAQRFIDAKLPIVGDDIKSQVGATITHRVLARLMEDRGMTIDRTYQLNFGGNMDFKNMLERTRLESKKISKTQSVTSQIEAGIESDSVHIGPSDHVPWLEDRKWAYIRLEGRNFGDVPLNIELKLEVWDSPNSAGVIIDAVRCCKLALDRGIGGPLDGPSSYFMKSPAVQHHDDEARDLVEAFIRGDV